MSQVRPPEDQMPGRGIAYAIAGIGLLIAAVIAGVAAIILYLR